MTLANGCCFRGSLKKCSIIIGVILLIFTLAFLFTTVGIIADWKKFDTSFLDDRLSK